ncbi:GNAT family N-acetyltransferase [Clostridium cellulovorans]|uniref:GCN5-related N-acetyltransferase n=1 Tax=Clostridium cellulovorans (strain ATCC 35296 / DSM 3052 / OCM 3 / 743B) TaxID=573061 RepID=D9STY3_CLOC7|nr:GNAT family N-acetyltransferase [Clostridium cellulovorans]ADL50821.1 GCN5-related N-acetyltransferase [Clostridium cellulovorans 743B]
MYHIEQFEKKMQSQVTEFYEKCLPESGRLFDPEGVHKALTEIEKNYDFFLCLFDGSIIIGTIAVNRLDEKKCELRSVYLLKEYHGKGLGTKMMKEAICYAKACGFHEMYLDTISSTSQRAIRMYQSYGFINTEKYKNTIRSDIFMKLILKE